jgi:hypothetical protein
VIWTFLLTLPPQNRCGTAQNYDLINCNGSFDSNKNTAGCRGKFLGCVCIRVQVRFVNLPPLFSSLEGCPCVPRCVYNPIWVPPPLLPPLENPWYCVGLAEADDCRFRGCIRQYSLGVMNMDAGTLATDIELNAVAVHSPQDLWRVTINEATVISQGDISVECADLHNSWTCRIYCPSLGGGQVCWDITNAVFTNTQSMVLVCDRALP